jgi:hypothetical protein
MKEFVMGITGEGMSFHNKRKINDERLYNAMMTGTSKPWAWNSRHTEIENELKLKETYPCRDVIH